MLSNEARMTLVQIARQALQEAVAGQEFLPEDPGLEELHAQCGCFVTYRTGGRLRGCLGCFTSADPLYRTVAHYAFLSATEDPRFAGNRIRPDELGRVDLDISVLSPLTPCDDPLAIELGTHGIYIKRGFQTGCFLPQVATETGWSKEAFWIQCCATKAGLAADAWKNDPEVERYVFTAEVIEDAAGG